MEAIFRKPVGWLDLDHQLMDMNNEKEIVIDNLFRDALAVTPQNVAKSLLQVLRSSHKLAHSARAMRYERQLKWPFKTVFGWLTERITSRVCALTLVRPPALFGLGFFFP
jgi:hypothetical protein